jgi:hypothetical protein
MRTTCGTVGPEERRDTGASARRPFLLGRSARLRGWLLAGLASLTPTPVLATVTIESFSLRPASPNTGDPVVLSAIIQSTSSCNFIDAAIGFGPQPELGGQNGWAITVDFQDGVIPVASTCPIEKNFGTLQVAAGDGVLRARSHGTVDDVMPFALTIAAGPAPGWDGPALHAEGFSQLTQSSALTALPGGLAMSDQLNRRILLVDPGTDELLSSIPSPGSGDVRGLAYDGTNLYASVRDAFAPRIYKIDLLGRVLDAFPSPVISPGSAPLEGLAFLNGVLYGSYASPPRLFAIDPVTHQKLWDRALPGMIKALDAAPEGLLGAEPDGYFYLIGPSPTSDDVLLADPIDTGITNLPNLAGLAYDGFGIYAWDSASASMLFMRTFALWWAVDGTLQSYLPGPDLAVDVIRGDVGDTLQLAGYFDLAFFAPPQCLASGGAGGPVAEPDDPPLGHAFYYVARFIDAAGREASYGRTSDGFRRIDTSAACP